MLPPGSKVNLLIKKVNLLFHLNVPKSSVSGLDIYLKKRTKNRKVKYNDFEQ